MKKIFCFFAVFVLSFGLAWGQPVSSESLISHARLYDGKTVVYRGEVIGDVMRRGNYAWLNIHDGTNAIGIWVPLELAQVIIYTGHYKSRGDIVEISGIFNRACSKHGGDLDIHAQSLRKISQGKPVNEKINPSKVNQVLILLGVLIVIWISTLFLKK